MNMNMNAFSSAALILCLTQPIAALAETLPHVRVVSPRTADLAQTVRVSGSVVARDLVQVHARQSGLRIEELLVEERDTVVAGQVLAVLDSADLMTAERRAAAGLEQATARVDTAEQETAIARIEVVLADSEASRAEELHAKNSFTTEALEQRRAARDRAVSQLRLAEAAYAAAVAAQGVARADLEAAREALDQTEIRAPVGGLILSRQAERGQPADALFQIAAEGAMELSGKVLQQDFLHLREGMSAQVTLPGQAPVQGRIRRLSGRVDPATRMGEVRIELLPGATAGAFAYADITIEQVEGLVLPMTSVVGGRVWIVRDGIVTAQSVARRPAIGDLVPVMGLSPDDLVVLHLEGFVTEGMQVAAVETAFLPEAHVGMATAAP
ncbi:hypothetical protein FALB51S_02582 [Frigidibacter albus]|uniref:Hemolysin D n=2 Tax=Frigidibacter mobilis TaxID=1335048 RepID=A0A161GJM0_9RHOB|nr:hemolysin D [Frigidibacter mobilis]